MNAVDALKFSVYDTYKISLTYCNIAIIVCHVQMPKPKRKAAGATVMQLA